MTLPMMYRTTTTQMLGRHTLTLPQVHPWQCNAGWRNRPHAVHDVMQPDQCFAVDQSVPRRRQDTTTLRRSTRSADGQQRNRAGHPTHRKTLCAHGRATNTIAALT